MNYNTLPTLEEYVAHQDYWNKLQKRLILLKREHAMNEIQRKIQKEREEIEAEREAFVDRAKNLSEWEYCQDFESNVCVMAEDPNKNCAKTGYLLKGTEEVFVCSQCIRLNPGEDDQVREAIYEEAPTYWSRAQDPKNWIEEEPLNPHDVDCDEDDCWFQGNLDRLGDYVATYRLRGTTIRMCNICFTPGNFSVLMTEKIEAED